MENQTIVIFDEANGGNATAKMLKWLAFQHKITYFTNIEDVRRFLKREIK